MKATTTYIVLMAACLMLLASARAMAVDCAAIRAACLDRCQTLGSAAAGATRLSSAQQRDCANRCSIASCQQTPLALRVSATVHFAPVPMHASHRLLQHSPLSRLRLRAGLRVARN